MPRMTKESRTTRMTRSADDKVEAEREALDLLDDDTQTLFEQ